MPRREHLRVIVANAQLERNSHIGHIDFEVIACTGFEGVGFTVQFDIVGFAFATVEDKLHLSIGTGSFDVTGVDPNAPGNS